MDSIDCSDINRDDLWRLVESQNYEPNSTVGGAMEEDLVVL